MGAEVRANYANGILKKREKQGNPICWENSGDACVCMGAEDQMVIRYHAMFSAQQY